MILALLLALAAPVAPQAAAPAPKPARQQVRLNLSPAGQAVAKKYLGTPDTTMQGFAQRLAGVGQKMRALSSGAKLDLAALSTLVREQESLQSSMRKRANDQMLAMLGEMSEADRIAFIRGVASAQPGKAAPR